jgi:hypothetical protein
MMWRPAYKCVINNVISLNVQLVTLLISLRSYLVAEPLIRARLEKERSKLALVEEEKMAEAI